MSGRLAPWLASIRGRPIGPLVFMLVFGLGLGAVFWGALVADPDFKLQEFDAGPVTRFAIGRVEAYPEQNLYVVGLADGRIRAVDGIVKSTGCAVEFIPDDERGAERNPQAKPGVYRDPCSGAVWAITGDAIEGTNEPLRTFHVSYHRNESDVRHVWVELLGDRAPSNRPRARRLPQGRLARIMSVHYDLRRFGARDKRPRSRS